MKKIHLQDASAQIARPNTIRDINRQIVLNYVRDQAPISRAEIARKTKLQRSTVSSIIESLQKSGLIETIGVGSSTGGRKPTLLRIRTGFPVAIGVDLNPRVTTIAVVDLAGQIIEKQTFDTTDDIDKMAQKIIKVIKSITKKYPEHELEVGISIPGIANRSNGNIIYVPYFNWSDYNIGEKINKSTGLKVIVDNDANSIALAELWFGREVIRKVRNFITVLVGEGIGTGIIFDGQVYSGEKGAAGEFGHMIIGSEAQVECSCGSRVCWEAFASEKAIISRYKKNNKNLELNKPIDLKSIIKKAKEGEKAAFDVLQETAQYLGIGIANLVIGLSPQAIVISGELANAWEMISDTVKKTAKRSVRKRLPDIIITASSLKADATLTGAFSLVLANKFASAS